MVLKSQKSNQGLVSNFRVPLCLTQIQKREYKTCPKQTFSISFLIAALTLFYFRTLIKQNDYETIRNTNFYNGFIVVLYNEEIFSTFRLINCILKSYILQKNTLVFDPHIYASPMHYVHPSVCLSGWLLLSGPGEY